MYFTTDYEVKKILLIKIYNFWQYSYILFIKKVHATKTDYTISLANKLTWVLYDFYF
jgi:hypothetical protein